MTSTMNNTSSDHQQQQQQQGQSQLQQRLESIMRLPENQLCCDCLDLRPTWASLILPPKGAPNSARIIGGFSCSKCSSIHRTLGKGICRVKDTSLAGELKAKELTALERGGNRNLNAIFEAKKLDKDHCERPDPIVDASSREKFVRDKYVALKFYDASIYDVVKREQKKKKQRSLGSIFTNSEMNRQSSMPNISQNKMLRAPSARTYHTDTYNLGNASAASLQWDSQQIGGGVGVSAGVSAGVGVGVGNSNTLGNSYQLGNSQNTLGNSQQVQVMGNNSIQLGNSQQLFGNSQRINSNLGNSQLIGNTTRTAGNDVTAVDLNASLRWDFHFDDAPAITVLAFKSGDPQLRNLIAGGAVPAQVASTTTTTTNNAASSAADSSNNNNRIPPPPPSLERKPSNQQQHDKNTRSSNQQQQPPSPDLSSPPIPRKSSPTKENNNGKKVGCEDSTTASSRRPQQSRRERSMTPKQSRRKEVESSLSASRQQQVPPPSSSSSNPQNNKNNREDDNRTSRRRDRSSDSRRSRRSRSRSCRRSHSENNKRGSSVRSSSRPRRPKPSSSTSNNNNKGNNNNGNTRQKDGAASEQQQQQLYERFSASCDTLGAFIDNNNPQEATSPSYRPTYAKGSRRRKKSSESLFSSKTDNTEQRGNEDVDNLILKLKQTLNADDLGNHEKMEVLMNALGKQNNKGIRSRSTERPSSSSKNYNNTPRNAGFSSRTNNNNEGSPQQSYNNDCCQISRNVNRTQSSNDGHVNNNNHSMASSDNIRKPVQRCCSADMGPRRRFASPELRQQQYQQHQQTRTHDDPTEAESIESSELGEVPLFEGHRPLKKLTACGDQRRPVVRSRSGERRRNRTDDNSRDNNKRHITTTEGSRNIMAGSPTPDGPLVGEYEHFLRGRGRRTGERCRAQASSSRSPVRYGGQVIVESSASNSTSMDSQNTHRIIDVSNVSLDNDGHYYLDEEDDIFSVEGGLSKQPSQKNLGESATFDEDLRDSSHYYGRGGSDQQ